MPHPAADPAGSALQVKRLGAAHAFALGSRGNVEVGEVGAVNTAHLQHSGPVTFPLPEVDSQFVPHANLKAVGQQARDNRLGGVGSAFKI